MATEAVPARTGKTTTPKPEQEAIVALLGAADRLRHRLATLLERHGVTVQQYNVLRILRGARDEPLPTLAIADRMIERTPGITRLLDRLERKRLIHRERCDEDRRRVLCTITPPGLEMLAELDRPVERIDRQAFDGLGRRELAELIGLLDRCVVTES